MDALQKRAVEAEEAGDLPLALELWKERSKSDEDGIAFLQYGTIALDLEQPYFLPPGLAPPAKGCLPHLIKVFKFLLVFHFAGRLHRRNTSGKPLAAH
jgi:hypothetical protein